MRIASSQGSRGAAGLVDLHLEQEALCVGFPGEVLGPLFAERVAVAGPVPALAGTLLDEAHNAHLSFPHLTGERKVSSR